MTVSLALFRILLADATQAQASAAAVTVEKQGGVVLSLAEAWRVLPLLHKAIARLGLVLDETDQQRLRHKLAAAVVRSAYVARISTDVNSRLAQAGIDAVAFKGIWSLAHLHDSPATRMIGDIDLLVDPSQVERTLAALADLGFGPKGGVSPDDVRRFLGTMMRADNHSMALANEVGLEIDLHWRLLGGANVLLSSRGLWQRAQNVSLSGGSVRAASPVDGLVLMIHHALRNQLMPFTSVRDLYDLALWWSRFASDHVPEPLLSRARECELVVPLLAFCSILHHMGAIAPHDPSFSALQQAVNPDEREESVRLAAWYLDRLGKPDGLNAIHVDLFMLLAGPRAVSRLARNGFLRLLRPGLRAVGTNAPPPKGHVTRRIFHLLRGIMRLRRADWRNLRILARLQRRAFGPLQPK